MNITSAGIGSGLDLEGIIEAYINAEAIPQELRLQRKEDRINAELSGVGQFKSALSSFETALKKLDSVSEFNKQNIEVSNDDISVTTNGFASNGTFSVEVQQLAQGSKIQSGLFADSSTALGTAGTLRFTAGSDTFDVAIDATDNLSSIRDKINEQAENFGVVVNVMNTGSNSFLTFDSEKTGGANALTITSPDATFTGITDGTTETRIAQGAIIEIDDNGFVLTSDTNEFKNFIEDVTITAKKENIGSPSTLTISQDEENGDKLVKDFVNSYNSLIATLDLLSNPETGELAFDPNIRQLKAQMTNIVTTAISSAPGAYDSLDDIGVTLNRDGQLEINPVAIGTLPSGSEKLSDALKNSLNEVGELFASSDGVATQLKTLLDSYNGTDGTLTVRKSSLSAELSSVKDEWEALEERLRAYEEGLRAKFTFLDQTVSQFNATSSWLASTLENQTKSKD